MPSAPETASMQDFCTSSWLVAICQAVWPREMPPARFPLPAPAAPKHFETRSIAIDSCRLTQDAALPGDNTRPHLTCLGVP